MLEVGSCRCLEGVHRVEIFRGDLEAGLKGVFGLDFVLGKYGVSARGQGGKEDTTKRGGRTDTRIEPCPQVPVEPPIVK